MLSWARASRWNRISSSISCSSLCLRIMAASRRSKDIFNTSAEFQYGGNSAGHPFPGFFLALQLLAPDFSERVVTSAAIVFGYLPLGLDPALLLHALQRRI